MKKKIGIIIILIFGFHFYGFSQINPKNDETQLGKRFLEKRKEIEAAKKEYITNRINLTEEQSKGFWPIYDKYIQDKLILRRKTRMIVRSGINISASDEQLAKTIDNMIALKQEEVDLEKKLKLDLLKIINIRQLAELYRSEQDFISYIISILKDRD